MKCVTPMFRVFNVENPKQGRVLSRQKGMQLLELDNNAIKHKLAAWHVNTPKHWKKIDVQKIPCKKCWACQLNYSAEWATRIMLEAQKSECNWFITLTYDDEHLPIAEKINLPNGKTYENDGTWTGTLYEQHMIRFLNSLRKEYEKDYKGIKYFYCGEYGEESRILPDGRQTQGRRPHFHIILLHTPLRLEDFYGCHVDSNYKAHWKSKQIENLWAEYVYDENGKHIIENGEKKRIKRGIVDICELEWSCAAYVARYCTKKITFNTDKTEYYENGKMPEFIRMSKGIGFDYFRENMNKIYDTDEIIMRTVKGNIGSAKPPKAFDRKLEQIDPDMLEKIKESRKHAAERAEEYLRTQTDRTDYENLIMDAEKVKTKMQMLPRVGEW